MHAKKKTSAIRKKKTLSTFTFCRNLGFFFFFIKHLYLTFTRKIKNNNVNKVQTK